MKRFIYFSISVLCLLLWALPQTARAQTDNFQDGLIITIGPQFYYARANGDVYLRRNDPWQEPPQYKGNFFFGQPVPSDFLAGFRAALGGALLYYASSTGDVYRQEGGGAAFTNPPNRDGNFFFGQAVPADFQKGFHIVAPIFYYVSEGGDVYSQAQWDEPPHYLGHFFNGQPPLGTSRSTIGGVKSKYRK